MCNKDLGKSTTKDAHRFLVILISIAMVFTSSVMPADAATKTNYKSYLMSTVQKYEKDTGYFVLKKSSRFFIVSTSKPSAKLTSTVKLVDSEFADTKKPSSTPLKIVYGDKALAKTGDIVINMVLGYKAGGYKMTIGKKVEIRCSDTDAVLYALRTLLQYRICSGTNKLKACSVRDYPDVKERVIHLDCARKHFSKNWIKNFIKRASWQKYNAIEIHFNEDQGLRLQSRKYPWLAGSSNSSSVVLSQASMAEICDVAKKYHVEVIPSFDSPGHMNYITKKYRSYVKEHPNFTFTYQGKKYSKSSTGFKNISNYFKYNGKKSDYNYLGIDLANPTARAFTSSLIDEYADFFAKQGCKKFNIGGDELLGWSSFNLGGKSFTNKNKWKALQHWEKYARNTLNIKSGSASDTFISYMNQTAKRLEGKGYKCRMWNDEINRCSNQHVKLRKSVEVVYWSNDYAPLSKLIDKGYKHYYSASSQWCYYVLGVPYEYSTGSYIYKNWKPRSVALPKKKAIYIPKDKFSGAYFCIWCDRATSQSQAQVWSNTKKRTWANSAIMWNTSMRSKTSGNGKALKYANFVKLQKKLGTFPGYSGDPGRNSVLPKASALEKAQ